MQERHRRAHLLAWLALGLLLPLLLVGALARRGGPAPEPPQRLAPPGAGR